jgi:quercetin dioxygenase-like cupin family protein
MKIASIVAVGWIGFCCTAAFAMAEDAHAIFAPGDVKWIEAPKMLPAGAQAAVLFGNPAKKGLFALRLKVPSGYAIPPHTHPGYEVVTVLSGTAKFGMGKTADRGATKALPAGSFFALPPGTAHFVYFDDETVIQINTNGPWGIKYVNPADDPQKSQ